VLKTAKTEETSVENKRVLCVAEEHRHRILGPGSKDFKA
jgi:hypothetical protein